MTHLSDGAGPEGPDNAVFLRGRLAAPPVVRALPSGDELVSFRLTVTRPAGGRAKVDSIECVAFGARARRSLLRAAPGDEVEANGALHRRFWRSPAGPASRYEVEVDSVRLTRRRSVA